ncbi:NAD(+) synthase [Megasphaera vaginalis (ex Srinivasan et al. 2021)]|uniref:Glutamine-dependent NAD(+) synthetase n=1 Tax=Megasphaera vaginalis (ex Srinivasan et al. 2021) TaxID=1111454 RepID=U7UR82_9FIRM|nr:NAD(+) synthase [Megasphaera vaginalis (ex Srinivasan et al. 2021)]ERT61952.1 putative NAD+ synthetase [Megasphaera vaginalis (ex Srinivasan et al. 2021)]
MFTIGLSQFDIKAADPRANTARMKADIGKAKAANCDILIFPELSIPGYFIGDIWDQPDFIDECVAFGKEIQSLSEGITLIFGNVAKEEGRVNLDGRLRKYNAMFIARDGKLISPGRSPYPFYIKTLLPNYREFSDIRYFTSLMEVAQERHAFPEDFLSPVQLSFGDKGTLCIGPLICEDSWDENYPFKPMAYLGEMYDIDLFVNISNSPFTLGKTDRRHRLFGNAIGSLHRPAVYVNCTGIQNNGKNIYTFDGSSGAYNGDGSLHYQCDSFTEELAVVQFDKATGRFASAAKTAPPKGETAELYDSLHFALSSFLRDLGLKKVVIGVSGGIDSAVNAALYASVLPPENILLINMPSCYNSATTKGLAKELADNIGCLYTVIPVQESLELSRQQFAEAALYQSGKKRGHLELTSFIEENIQARDRSSRILAAAAAAFGGVFTCNANKAESAVGYATLYGDSAGFLAATADLWKHQVYDLARYLNQAVFRREVVPQGSIDIIPSAELSANQNIDKGQGDPLIYPYHDYLFAAFIERWQRATPQSILEWYAAGTLEDHIGCPLKVAAIFPTAASFIADLEKWWNLIAGFAVAKRIQAPPLLAVSRRSFGNDLRESQVKPYYSTAYLALKEKLLRQ